MPGSLSEIEHEEPEMRLLIWHVDSFRSTVTEKGRSGFVEEPAEKETYVEEALIVLTAVEKTDEAAPETVARKAAKSIKKHAKNLKVTNISEANKLVRTEYREGWSIGDV